MAARSIAPYIMSLDDPGDLQAPKDSSAWARAIRYRLYRLAKTSKTKVRDFQRALKLFEEHQGYRQLEDEQGQPFQSLGAFASARIPFGLGYDPEIILHLQQETRDMLLKEKLQQLVAQATGSTEYGGRPKTANCAVLTQTARAQKNGIGVHSQRKLDYLAAHAPMLLTEVQEGRLSIHRAYTQAKPPAPWVRKLTPLDYLILYWRQVDQGDRIRFLLEMLTPNERRALHTGCALEDND